jgi:beta-fructofuranosidase
MATGNKQEQMARLLLYRSEDLLHWSYLGVMSEWSGCRYAECPSFMRAGELCLLSASVSKPDRSHYFSLMLGDFENGIFSPRYTAEVDKGPDQYAGQIFRDHRGRCILMSWAPGWKYQGYAARDIGCMSVPREIRLVDGKIKAYPVEELRHLLKDEDPAVKRTENGFVIERTGRDSVVFEGKIDEPKILRDEYLVEVYVNGGEEVYTALL